VAAALPLHVQVCVYGGVRALPHSAAQLCCSTCRPKIALTHALPSVRDLMADAAGIVIGVALLPPLHLCVGRRQRRRGTPPAAGQLLPPLSLEMQDQSSEHATLATDWRVAST
jgi:hypothetical protein